MKVELLVVPSCPNEAPAHEAYRRALLSLGIEAEINTVVIDNYDQAQARGFLGSPSFFIDGSDLLPAAGATPGVACRVYNTPAGLAGVPERDALVKAIATRTH